MIPVIRPIHTEADYQAALQLVAPYFENEPEVDSDVGAHFEAMLTLIEAYEAKHYPIDPPDSPYPVDAIKSGWSSKASSTRTSNP